MRIESHKLLRALRHEQDATLVEGQTIDAERRLRLRMVEPNRSNLAAVEIDVEQEHSWMLKLFARALVADTDKTTHEMNRTPPCPKLTANATVRAGKVGLQVLHVLTVHWQSDQWIDIQLRYLRRNLRVPTRRYAFLNDVPGDHAEKFDYTSREEIVEHAVKLNRLAEVACARAESEDDILVFIDGDAFPIGNLAEYLDRRLSTHAFVAVQRRENLGDCQPHPCFAATTVGLWQRVQGDWCAGFSWETSAGLRKTDVGGNLLRILRDHGIEWYPMLRSNRRNLHPLLFAIYDGIVYHHGAGFRTGVSHVERAQAGLRHAEPAVLHAPEFATHPMQQRFKELCAANESLKHEMFASICSNDGFFLRLQTDDE